MANKQIKKSSCFLLLPVVRRGRPPSRHVLPAVLDPVLLVVHLARVGHHVADPVRLAQVGVVAAEAAEAGRAGATGRGRVGRAAHGHCRRGGGADLLFLLPDLLLSLGQRLPHDDERGVLGDERLVILEHLSVLIDA